MKRYYVMICILLLGCAVVVSRPEETQGQVLPPSDGAIVQMTYTDGLILWSDASQAPRTIYRLWGEMTITIYASFVRVQKPGAENVWFIPLAHVHYIGKPIQISS